MSFNVLDDDDDGNDDTCCLKNTFRNVWIMDEDN